MQLRHHHQARHDGGADRRLTRQAEAAGFEYGWIFDSHVLWLEPYPMLTLMATNTKNMRLGTCVTNPATRDITVTSSLFATLNLISGGRMQLGIGRGDSSRRVLGKKPVTVAQLEESVKAFRDLTGGKEIEYEGRTSAAHLGDRRRSAGVGCGIWTESARTGWPDRRRRHLAVRRSGLDRVVRRFRQEGRRSRGKRSAEDRDHGGRAGLDFRRSESGPRTGALVSCAGVESCRRSGFALQAGGTSARSDLLYTRPRPVRLPSPLRSRQQQRELRVG